MSPFSWRSTKDYLEDNVDEKYYINNEKAEKLIKQLIDNGTLPQHNLDRQTFGQIETWLLKDMGETADKHIDVAVTLRARDYKGLDNYGSNGVIEVMVENKAKRKVIYGEYDLLSTQLSGMCSDVEITKIED